MNTAAIVVCVLGGFAAGFVCCAAFVITVISEVIDGTLNRGLAELVTLHEAQADRRGGAS